MGLRIAILSRGTRLYSTTRLKNVAQERGHEVHIFNPLKCSMNIMTTSPSIHYKGERIGPVDVVIPRIGASISFYGSAVLRQFEMMGAWALNPSLAVMRARDKLLSLQLLARAGLNLPVTSFSYSPQDVAHLIHTVGGAPVVLKLLEGTQGIGVVLADSKETAESTIQAFMGAKVHIMVQEYLKEAKGADLRCFVIGDRVVASMLRQAKAGEFRANLHRGGRAMAVALTDEEEAMAIRAAQTIGLHVAGVDLMRTERGSVLLEVNASPGLQGIETVTQHPIAEEIIDFIERSYAPAQS